MEFAVYIFGVIVLGIFYEPVKLALGGGVLFVLAVVVYLLAVRLIGYGLRHYLQAKGKNHA
jgi:hypothetical protein